MTNAVYEVLQKRSIDMLRLSAITLLHFSLESNNLKAQMLHTGDDDITKQNTTESDKAAAAVTFSRLQTGVHNAPPLPSPAPPTQVYTTWNY